MGESFKNVLVKVKKEVSLGTLLSILVPIGISIFLWAISTSGTLQIHEEKIKKLEEKAEKIDDELKENYKTIDRKIDEIKRILIDRK